MNRKKRWFALICVFVVLFIGMVAGIGHVTRQRVNQYMTKSLYTTPTPNEEEVY